MQQFGLRWSPVDTVSSLKKKSIVLLITLLIYSLGKVIQYTTQRFFYSSMFPEMHCHVVAS